MKHTFGRILILARKRDLPPGLEGAVSRGRRSPLESPLPAPTPSGSHPFPLPPLPAPTPSGSQVRRVTELSRRDSLHSLAIIAQERRRAGCRAGGGWKGAEVDNKLTCILLSLLSSLVSLSLLTIISIISIWRQTFTPPHCKHPMEFPNSHPADAESLQPG